MRMTHQREIILQELKMAKDHPTADELFQRVRKHLPKISLGTVYRNLEILAEAQTIQKIEVGGRQKRFDGNPMPHYHVRCVQCGRVDDVPVGRIKALDSMALKPHGYKILDHHLEFTGICPACQEKGLLQHNKTLT